MPELIANFWPWWLGGAALAAVAVGFLFLLGSPLGVSGFCETLLAGPAAAREREAILSDSAALEAAMLAATQARFGIQATATETAAPSIPEPPAAPAIEPLSWNARLAFLLALAAGGFLSAFLSGRFEAGAGLGEDFSRYIGGGWKALLALVGGGFLAGFGTRMAGGCTSGHGLTGNARFQPASLLATASFFGTAIAVSYALEALIK